MKQRIFTTLLMLMAIVMMAKAQSKEAYAVISVDQASLTFYYDTEKATREGTICPIPWDGYFPKWHYYDCSTITTVDLSESFADYHDLQNAMYMFQELKGITSIGHLERLNTENVTTMYGMFQYCDNLEELDLSHFNTSKVEDMQSMFRACPKLTVLDVSGFDVQNVTNMIQMFQQCTNLTTIYCNKNWKTDKLVNHSSMFYLCTSLVGAITYDESKINADYANPTTGYFTNAVSINETNFPDAKFRAWLLATSYGQDGLLTEAEITSVTAMSLDRKQIADLKGIEYFTRLTDLSCRNNRLTSLDLSQNTAIHHLDCAENQLTSLVMGRCAPIDFFQCSGNQLSGQYMDTFLINLPPILDGSKPKIYIYNENLSNEQNTLTQEQIATLIGKGWQAVFTLKVNSSWADLIIENAADVPLTKYNFPDANFRAWLSSKGYVENYLLKADKLSTTYSLDVSSQEIADLTGIGFFRHLDELYCYNNQISGEAMDALVQSLPTVDKGQLVVIDDESMSELNTMTTEQANAASMKGWTPWTTSDECLADYIAINETNFPDDNFRDCLLAERYGQDYILTVGEIAHITSLAVGWKDIADLTGIQYFTALKTLNCPFNQLTKLDLSGLNNLQTVYCDANQIGIEAMGALVQSLCDRHGNDYGQLYALYNANEQNAITTQQVILANAKNWKVYLYAGEKWIEYSARIAIDQNTFPDENFRNWLLAQDFGADGMLSAEEIADVTSMDVHSQNIADLTGIEYFTALQFLQCQDNQLTTLDVTANIRLGYLDCSINQLESIHVSPTLPLANLYCSSNKLGIEAMTDIFENLCDRNGEAYGKINVLSNTDEHNFVTTKQVRMANAKNWKVYKQLEDGQWIEYPAYDIAYATNIVDYLLGMSTPTTFNAAAADVNGDGRVSIADVAAIVNQQLLEASKDQLRSDIKKCRAVLANCRADLEYKDSGHERADLWSELERLDTAVDDLATAVEKATTKNEIISCTSELTSILSCVTELQMNIIMAFH